MFTWKLLLVFSICIGISQSQYDYDGNDYYEDDFREREKISFKTIPSKFYFQKGGDTIILAMMTRTQETPLSCLAILAQCTNWASWKMMTRMQENCIGF